MTYQRVREALFREPGRGAWLRRLYDTLLPPQNAAEPSALPAAAEVPGGDSTASGDRLPYEPGVHCAGAGWMCKAGAGHCCGAEDE